LHNQTESESLTLKSNINRIRQLNRFSCENTEGAFYCMGENPRINYVIIKERR
jgi:hypothetical protein